MIPWILQTETSKHCLLKLKLGKLGEGVCGRGGVGLVFWDIPGFIFFWNFSLLLHLCSIQKKKCCIVLRM
uniref:Uncharacterized protein n=1 Tax=Buteo japonicus TaxID=224669 RepID=A0A8C0BKT5_9AVES